jgi:hypothetical protein
MAPFYRMKRTRGLAKSRRWSVSRRDVDAVQSACSGLAPGARNVFEIINKPVQ